MRAWTTAYTLRHRQWSRAGDNAARRRRVRRAADHRGAIAIIAPVDARAIEVQRTDLVVERLGSCLAVRNRIACGRRGPRHH
jgi:hypothetical protein